MNVSHDNLTDYESINLDPHLGYFFFDKFLVSINLIYNYRETNSSIFRYYSIGPAVRYFINTSGPIKPFFGTGISYSIYDVDDNINLTRYDFNMGAAYFIKKYFAVEGTIDYNFENGDGNKISVFSIGIGVGYYIN